MAEILQHWEAQNIRFDAIYTGYLGSIAAIEETERLCSTLLKPQGILVVDPAMADHGRLYSGFDTAYAEAMKELCTRADLILPNITEAAMLSGMAFSEPAAEEYVSHLLEALHHPGVVLTGVDFGPSETGVAIRLGNSYSVYRHRKFPKSYHGTGDLFASCLVGAYLRGKSLQQSAQIAADTVCCSIQNTLQHPEHWYGVRFETAIPGLLNSLS